MSAIISIGEKHELILSRLRLAQALLEESDYLKGKDAYDFENDKRLQHPRHEREALVIYLLLTCFDYLGQEGRFITLSEWLKSKKQHHKKEKEQIINNLSCTSESLDITVALVDEYYKIYGVKNAFYYGINSLSNKLNESLLTSLTVRHRTDVRPNVSTRADSIEDKEKEKALKLKYLFQLRNRFTHQLMQHHITSVPIMSEHVRAGGASWNVLIRDGKLTYMGQNTEQIMLKDGTAHIYMTCNWPFVLFEVLYGAIGVVFDRTSIKLTFQVMLMRKGRTEVRTFDGISHDQLKDVLKLEASL